jgi:hypothetical protein
MGWFVRGIKSAGQHPDFKLFFGWCESGNDVERMTMNDRIMLYGPGNACRIRKSRIAGSSHSPIALA